MALFGSKKKKADAKEEKPSAAKGPQAAKDYARTLKQPRITEKATFVTGASNVYVFEVDERATKGDIAAAMKVFYKVDPVKVAITRIPAKKVRVRGKLGVKPGGKKAYVYLKEGQTIEIL